MRLQTDQSIAAAQADLQATIEQVNLLEYEDVKPSDDVLLPSQRRGFSFIYPLGNGQYKKFTITDIKRVAGSGQFGLTQYRHTRPGAACFG